MKSTRHLYQDADDDNNATAEMKADRVQSTVLHAMFCPECGGDGDLGNDGQVPCVTCRGTGTVLC